MTHSERKWLVEQMASQRRRPAPSDRSAEAEESPAASSEPPPTTIEPASPTHPTHDDAPRATTGDGTPRRRAPRAPHGTPGTQDSFWSFG